MPRVAGHHHLHQHVAGEDLALHGFWAVIRDLGDRLQGDADLLNQVAQAAVLHGLLDTGGHGVLIAGIGMNHIPLRIVSHVAP